MHEHGRNHLADGLRNTHQPGSQVSAISSHDSRNELRRVPVPLEDFGFEGTVPSVDGLAVKNSGGNKQDRFEKPIDLNDTNPISDYNEGKDDRRDNKPENPDPRKQ